MVSRSFRAAILAIAVLAGLAGPAAAQAFGTLGGTVRDARGDAVPGARISIVNTGTTAIRRKTSPRAALSFACMNLGSGLAPSSP